MSGQPPHDPALLEVGEPAPPPLVQAQPAYAQPTDARAPSSSGPALASLICGIASLVLALVPFLGLLSFPASIAGLITGVIALRSGQNRGMAIAGIVTSSIFLALFVLVIVVVVVILVANNGTFPGAK